MKEEYGEPLDKPFTVVNVVPKFLVRLGFQSISPNSVVVDQSLGLGFQYSFATYPRYAGPFPVINYSLKVGLAHK